MIVRRKNFKLNKFNVIEKVVLRPPFRFAALFDNEACFIYLRDGNATANSMDRVLTFQSKEAILTQCGNYFVDFIRDKSYSEAVIYAIHLYPEILLEIYQDEIPPTLKTSESVSAMQKVQSNNVIGHFIESLEFYFQNPTLINDEILRLKLKELILLLMQTPNSKEILNLMGQLFTPKEADIKRLIQTHLFSNLTVSELSTLANLSISSFKREFQKIFHTSPAKYIRTKRLERSADLLRNSNKSVSEIAYETGFTDASHLSRVFKKEYNRSPSDYKSAP